MICYKDLGRPHSLPNPRHHQQHIAINLKHIKHLHPSRVISNIKQRIGNFRSVLEKHGPNSFVKKHDKDENINQEKLDQYWDKRWNKEQDYYNREAKRKMKELNKQ